MIRRISQLVLLMTLIIAALSTLFAFEGAALSTSAVGVDGRRRPTVSNWKAKKYKTLHVDVGTKVVFNWVGSWHGIQLAKTRKNWRNCKSGGALTIKQPSLGGTYTLDTTGYKSGKKLFVFCPVHCDRTKPRRMRVIIKMKRKGPCKAAHNTDDCAKKPNCTWVGGKCRPLLPFV